jgi:hypothetical protein
MLRTDPYRGYAALRDNGRVFWSDEYFNGAWVVTGYDDVRAVLQDPRLSAHDAGSIPARQHHGVEAEDRRDDRCAH